MVALGTRSELQRALAAAESMAVHQRNYRRARDRALTKLSQKYKEEYLELLAKEKEKDEQEGKRWTFASNSDADLWTAITNHLSQDRGNSSADPQDESDNE